MNVHRLLEQRLQQAVAAVLPDADLAAVLVRPCPDKKFGDYQTNALISLAKERKMNPRQLAAEVLTKLDVREWCEEADIAGAGFLNLRLKTEAIAHVLEAAARSEHLFFTRSSAPRTIVIDFSSPNVAKPMHVGHIRSTILGDCLARTLRLLGHHVITDNHIGDWGTQFGMLLQYVRETQPQAVAQPEQLHLDDLEAFYREAKQRFDEAPAFAEAARRAVVDLQSGDPAALKLWEAFCRESLRHCAEIYSRLGVKFDYMLGESFYNPRLKGIVDELRRLGVARESEGAIAAFFDDPALKDHPALIQKSDGGFNYTTTDLATMAYRLETWKPEEIVYVTDGRQQLHFKQLFAILRKWKPHAKVRLIHVWFGVVLGEDGKPFKTRSGENVKLAELLNEAEERALKIVTEKNPELPESQRKEIARVVGLGATKYADLLPNRQSDYVFNWEKMLSLQGNTAPYLQYAYTRIRSIFRKAESSQSRISSSEVRGPRSEVNITTDEELALAKHLLNFGLVLKAVAEEYRPNFLCNYLYELAGHFTSFYENCPVLKSEPAQRMARLILCDLTGRVLKQGLDVLGIETLEEM